MRVLAAAPAGEHDPLENRCQQRGLGSSLGLAPDLLVVEEHQDGDRTRALVSRNECLRPGIRGREVVEAGRGDEFAVQAEPRRRLDREGHHIEAEQVTDVGPHLTSEVCREVTREVARTPHRHEVDLRVEGERVVLGAVEVDRELGHAQDAACVMEEGGLDGTRPSDRDPTGEAEVAVQP